MRPTPGWPLAVLVEPIVELVGASLHRGAESYTTVATVSLPCSRQRSSRRTESSGRRPRRWHALLTRHQELAPGRDSQGRQLGIAFTKGAYKRRPTNPRRPGCKKPRGINASFVHRIVHTACGNTRNR